MFWVIGNELENHATTRDLAMRLYEHCAEGPSARPVHPAEFRVQPDQAAGQPLLRDGRRDDARRVLLEIARPRDFPDYDEDYLAQMRMSGLAAAARQLVELGFPADAVPLYNEALAAAETIPENGPNYIGNLEGVKPVGPQGPGSGAQVSRTSSSSGPCAA